MADYSTPIPTDPKEVYATLRRLLDSGNLSLPEVAAVAYAMGVMDVTLPNALGKKES